MMTDPIADMLTRIRNALHARKEMVDVPPSRVKETILKVFAEEGFIKGYEAREEQGRSWIQIALAYDRNGLPVLRGVERVSKPSLRTYVGAEEIPPVQNGLGVNVLSTSRGVISDRQARLLHVGGEIVCRLW
jgi:small subunit ribosomal protein S8